MKILFATLLLFALPLHAGLFEEAEQAIEEGIPEVGIQKLRLYLTQNPAPEEVERVKLEIAAAQLQLGGTGDARETLSALPLGSRADYLLTQSYLIDQNWREVVKRLTILPAETSPYYTASVFARAEAMRGLGKDAAADKDYRSIEIDPVLGNAARLRRADLALLKGPAALSSIQLTATDDLAALQAATLLKAQSELLEKKYPEAKTLFQSLLDNPSQLTLTDYSAVVVGLARTKSDLGEWDDANDLLEKFIEDRPEHPRLNDVFAELNRVYEKQRNPSQNQLRRWSRDAANPQRQALSIYYQSQFDLRDRGSDAALDTLSSWLAKFPNHPLRSSVLLHYGEQLIGEGKLAEGILRLKEGLDLPSPSAVRGELYAVLARGFFANDRFAQAAASYQQATALLTRSAESLLYNAALSWLRDSNFDQFLLAYQQFSSLFPESDLRRDLLIEEGFLQARSDHFEQAKNTLELFIRDFPGHPRIPDAHLALAELNLQSSPEEADRQLTLAAQSMPSQEIDKRAIYLRFLQDSRAGNPDQDPKKQIEQCEAFLLQNPDSSFEADVRFKLGEAYFAEKNYTAAGTQFETIATKYPDSPFVEQARFLSGQSAIRTMNPKAIDDAISLFEEVVRMRGPLQAYARFEQAGVKKMNGAYSEALVLYNDLLNQKPPDDLRAAILAAKGETLYLQGSEDLAKVTASVETFDRLANLPGVSRYWRNLALYKKGKGLQWLGRKEEMLTSYYDTLAVPKDGDATPEFYWFYRSGFEAAEILEAEEKWEAAIAIYQKMAEAQGPRSAEAAERIQRLRLEHFIWEK